MFSCGWSKRGSWSFVPLKEDGEPVEGPEQFEALSAERKKLLADGREEVQRLAREFIKAQQEIARGVRDDVESSVRRFAAELIEPLVAAIAASHPQEAVRRHLGKVQQHLLANLDDFQEEAHQPALPFPFPLPSPRDRFVPYQVNLLVDNGGADGAPVVVEDVPTYQNLFGAIERMIDQTGKLVTNFTRIKAGSILRAAGGFLVFNLDDALTEPLVWKPLKRVLKSGRLEIESYNPFGFLSVSGMTPEPVAVDVRLLVTGSRQVFSLLSAYDPDFGEIFKVLADFVPEEPRTEGAEQAYSLRVAQTVRAEGLRHLTRGAVVEVVRQGIRSAGDRDRLSAHLEEVDDLVREASLVAEEAGAALVDEAAVREALARRDLPRRLVRAAGPRPDERGNGADRRCRQRGRPDQRALRARLRHPGLRAPLAADGERRPRQRRHHQHRARGQTLGEHARQGGADHRRLPAQPLRPGQAALLLGQPLLRADCTAASTATAPPRRNSTRCSPPSGGCRCARTSR